MPDPVVNFVQSTPQNLIVPPFRNPGVVQLLDWSGNIINSANPLPVSITGTIGENINVSQFGGNAVVTGAGAGGNGIPRVTISNDSSLAANQSTNLAQVGGSATPVGHGVAATALRVELPTDGTGVVGLNTGANTIGNVGLIAGTAIVGATGTFGRIDNTPTVQNASYVSGNCLGGLISLTLPATASGILQSVAIQFIGGATTVCTVFLFDANPSGSTFTDKSTFSIVAADEAKRINKNGYSLTPAAVTGDAVTAAAVDNLGKPFKSTGIIYMAVCAGGTFTPATATDLRVSITYFQNAQ